MEDHAHHLLPRPMTFKTYIPIQFAHMIAHVHQPRTHTDRESSGGVLEPEGTVEIKFKSKDLVKTMSRLDKRYAELLLKMKSPGGCGHM